MGLPFSVEWRTQVYGVGGVDSQRLSLGNQENVSPKKNIDSNRVKMGMWPQWGQLG